MITFYGALGFRVPDPASLESLPFPVFEIGVSRASSFRRSIATLRLFAFPFRKYPERSISPPSARLGSKIETGPMAMRGARGQGVSVYTRDPDQNLVEFIIYDSDEIEPEE